MGDIELKISRDRKGKFELLIVGKNQTDISNIEDQVLSMYVKGMATRDISSDLQDIYGADAIVFIDVVHFHVREDKCTAKKTVYIAIGTKFTGSREVCGMWIWDNECAKWGLGVLNEIKNRGVEDIMIVSMGGLTDFGDAIHAVFPKAEIHRFVVHQIRYSTKFVSYKDIKQFMKDNITSLYCILFNSFYGSWEQFWLQ